MFIYLPLAGAILQPKIPSTLSRFKQPLDVWREKYLRWICTKIFFDIIMYTLLIIIICISIHVHTHILAFTFFYHIYRNIQYLCWPYSIFKERPGEPSFLEPFLGTTWSGYKWTFPIHIYCGEMDNITYSYLLELTWHVPVVNLLDWWKVMKLKKSQWPSRGDCTIYVIWFKYVDN